jgi:hypothetical protein
MNNLPGIQRRLEKLKASITPPVKTYLIDFNMDLFTPEERPRFTVLWGAILARIKELDGEKVTMRNIWSVLSDAELYEFEQWVYLYDALERVDPQDAAIYRKKLRMTAEQIIAAFLALDLSLLPDDPNDPGPSMVEKNCITHFNRGNHRYMCINHIDQGKVGVSEIKAMYLWLTYYEETFSDTGEK